MPPFLEIAAVVVAIAGTIVGAGWTLWQSMSGKIDKAELALAARIKELEVVTPDSDAIKDIARRLEKMEELRPNFVTRDEYREGQMRMEGLVTTLASTIAQGNATLSSRMDTILFEIGKQNASSRKN